MTGAGCESSLRVGRTAAGNGLLSRTWDGVYIVYQPSSSETHVFNETTATVLRCLADGPLTIEALKARTEDALEVERGELGEEDFAFALRRLDELGLIDYVQEMDDIQ